jgi:hypothetical protein
MNQPSRIQNAKITSTMLGIEDHGIFTAWLYLSWDGSSQGFGGYILDEPRKDAQGKHLGRFGTAYGMDWIAGLMRALRIEKWEDLPGTFVRIEHEHAHIHRIGHLLEESWFDPALVPGSKP